MVVPSLLITALLQIAPVAIPGGDTMSGPAAYLRPAPAPTDSAIGAAWYRRGPRIDARLVPDWSRRPPTDTIPRRRRPVEYSDEYYSRLQLHRWGSWLEFPVFGAEYLLGQKLMSSDEESDGWVKTSHVIVAGTLGGLFAVNTITGVWNLYDSRNDPSDRALVWTHSALMLASDAGFAITASLAGDAHDSARSRDRHRNAALVSMGLASAGTLLMWIKRGL